jgi:prevent-host-death family protein
METIIPITDLQQKTKKYVNQVRLTRRPIVITQRGRAAAVLTSSEDFEGYLIMMDEMRYPDWRERWARAERESEEGKGIELAEFVKKEARRRRSRRG